MSYDGSDAGLVNFHSPLGGGSAGDAALAHGGGPLGVGDEGVDPHPEQGEDRGEQDGPDDDDGGGAVLATQQTLEERVKMEDNPDGEEELAEERAPGLITAVDGVGDAGDDADEVDHEDGGGRDEQRRPFEDVELGEVALVVGGLGRDREVGVDAGQHLEQTLEHREQMGRRPPDHPELLVPPPVLDPHTAPPQLHDSRREDGREHQYEPDPRVVAYLLGKPPHSHTQREREREREEEEEEEEEENR